MIAAFLCLVLTVHDGDGPLHCANGVSIRVAGIQAPDFQDTDPCRRGRGNYVCDDKAAERSRRIVDTMVRGRTLTCRQVDKSYRRVVAVCSLDGRDLACSIIAAGGAVRWDRYWRRYRLRGCR